MKIFSLITYVISASMIGVALSFPIISFGERTALEEVTRSSKITKATTITTLPPVSKHYVSDIRLINCGTFVTSTIPAALTYIHQFHDNHGTKLKNHSYRWKINKINKKKTRNNNDKPINKVCIIHF